MNAPAVSAPREAVSAELTAVLVAVTQGEPRVLTIEGDALPSGSLEPDHRSLQVGLRSWVERQTRHPLGYVEQLYTFADRDRAALGDRHISISYLGLTREAAAAGEPGVGWQDWYRFFPVGGLASRRSGGGAPDHRAAAGRMGAAGRCGDATGAAAAGRRQLRP